MKADQTNITSKKAETDDIEAQKRSWQIRSWELASRSKRWKIFLEFAKTKGIEAWEVIGLVYDSKAGTDLSEERFIFARAAKLLATTEGPNVNESLVTKKDLVNWNRQAILAMIEAEKQKGKDNQKIETGYQTIELINMLFPEFLIQDKKTSPFPKW